MTTPLARRDVLKILAGVPLVLGLPAGLGRVLAGDEKGDDAAPGGDPKKTPKTKTGSGAIADAIAAARKAGQGVLVLAAATDENPYDAATYARRQRLARHVAEMLESENAEVRLLIAQLTIVIATDAEVAALERGPQRGKGVTRPDGTWLIAPGAEGPAEHVPIALDAGDEEAARLVPWLHVRLHGAEGLRVLRGRADGEMAAMRAADRAVAEARLAALGDDAFETREAATAWLRERRGALLATLALRALEHRDAEVRIRSARLVSGEARAQPVGARWATFHGGCAQTEPYEEDVMNVMVDCGMALTEGPAREYLDIVAGAR